MSLQICFWHIIFINLFDIQQLILKCIIVACAPVSNRTCLAFAKATQMKISDLPHLHVYCLLCHTWAFVDLMDTTFMLALEHGGVHIPSLEVPLF